MKRVAEQAVVFDCGGDRLVGILHAPEEPSDTALVVVVGGPQYRAGSHRQFVQLARAVAAGGHAVLRFDCRGMGDASGEPRPFEAIGDDIRAAIDTVQRHLPAVQRVVLWGLCDGASAALLYWDATRDARVQGLALANPWVRSEASLARTHVKHYYGRRLLQREFWARLVKGRVGAGALRDFVRSAVLSRMLPQPAVQAFQDRMACAWRTFDGQMLLLLSGDDYTAKEFLEYVRASAAWAGALARPTLHRVDIGNADHTFATRAARLQVEDGTVGWLARHFAPARDAATAVQRDIALMEQE